MAGFEPRSKGTDVHLNTKRAVQKRGGVWGGMEWPRGYVGRLGRGVGGYVASRGPNAYPSVVDVAE